MKKGTILLLMVIILLSVLGCSKTQEVATKNENENKNEFDNKTEIEQDIDNKNEVLNGNEAMDEKENIDGNEEANEGNETPNNFDQKLVVTNFDMYALNLEDLSKGILTSLEFKVGSSFKDIVELWGEPMDEDYLDGGRYYLYLAEKYTFLFFDPEVDTEVKHIHIYPKFEVALNEVKEQLGKPDYESVDAYYELVLLSYELDTFTFYVFAKPEDEGSTVEHVFLKSMQ